MTIRLTKEDLEKLRNLKDDEQLMIESADYGAGGYNGKIYIEMAEDEDDYHLVQDEPKVVGD